MGNSNELLTIQEFAKASKRSKQAIYKQITTRLAPYIHEKEGRKFIEKKALQEVFQIQLGSQPSQPNSQPSQPELNNSVNPVNSQIDNQFAIFVEQLKEKDKQIERLQTENERLAIALENTTGTLNSTMDALKSSQALHAGTIQQQMIETTSSAPVETQKKTKWQKLKEIWREEIVSEIKSKDKIFIRIFDK